MACKPCEANRKKKGFRYYSTEQQARIARARENGEDVNVTVAKKRPAPTSNTETTTDR
jgi:hypothetical protein